MLQKRKLEKQPQSVLLRKGWMQLQKLQRYILKKYVKFCSRKRDEKYGKKEDYVIKQPEVESAKKIGRMEEVQKINLEAAKKTAETKRNEDEANKEKADKENSLKKGKWLKMQQKDKERKTTVDKA